METEQPRGCVVSAWALLCVRDLFFCSCSCCVFVCALSGAAAVAEKLVLREYLIQRVWYFEFVVVHSTCVVTSIVWCVCNVCMYSTSLLKGVLCLTRARRFIFITVVVGSDLHRNRRCSVQCMVLFACRAMFARIAHLRGFIYNHYTTYDSS